MKQNFDSYLSQKHFFKDVLLIKIQAAIYQKTPCRVQTLLKEMRSLHTLIRTTRTFIYPQYRVLLGNRLCKLNELFCSYTETFYVLGTNHTLFYLLVFIYQQFYDMFEFQDVEAS